MHLFTHIPTLFARSIGPHPTPGRANIMGSLQRRLAMAPDGFRAGVDEFYCKTYADNLKCRAKVRVVR